MKLRDRVTVLNATSSPDPYNTPIHDWETASESVEPALVTAVNSDEVLVNEDTVTSRWRVFLLPMTGATSRSRVVWRGDTFEVDGDVELHTDSRARPHHREALLKRVSN